jgi:hypothetical protein
MPIAESSTCHEPTSPIRGLHSMECINSASCSHRANPGTWEPVLDVLCPERCPHSSEPAAKLLFGIVARSQQNHLRGRALLSRAATATRKLGKTPTCSSPLMLSKR